MTPAFASVGEWLAMGQHGPFVWSSWGLTLLAVVAVSLYLPWERRRFWREESARQRRQVQRARQAQPRPESESGEQP
jgi:heme exporter protein D